MGHDVVTEGRYRIVESLGRGGMGEVCLADDLMLHRQVALKFLTSTTDGDTVALLLAEARAAAALDHPFICSIYEVSTLDDRPCIVMEYVRGETLERRLRRGPLPLAEGLEVAEEITEALDAAHRRRVVHRDLKPANVMLTEDRHVKVMDFGLALRLAGGDEEGTGDRREAPVSGGGTVCGTPAYMAPEQIRGAAADRRSDIFAFGVLLYELLAGVNPFARGSVDATLAAVLGETVADLHALAPVTPPAVGALVARLLAKDPAGRYQSFGDVRRDLRRLAIDAPVPAPAVGPVAAVTDHLPAGESSRLIGRDAERAQLLQGISQAMSGRGAFILLTGEAGIGKTRLSLDALDVARRRGCLTLVGRCYQRSGTSPLTPYIEVLEDASRLMPAARFRQSVGPGAPELSKLLPELRRLFPELPAPLELPPHLQQRFLFTNVREFVARASAAAPLVVLLDDLQWADESTIELTRHLAQHLAALPVLLIAAYRDVEPASATDQGAFQQIFDRVRGKGRDTLTPRAIKEVLSEIVNQVQGRAVALRPLVEGDVRRMLAALAGEDPPPGLVRTFVDHTGGNPFFVTELFRHLKEEGRLFDERNKWKRGVALDHADVPESVRLVLERRLQRLSPQTQQILSAAAVIGRHFELDLLQTVTDVNDEALTDALDEAEQARLVLGPAGRQEVTWRFAHQLIRQTLARGVPTLRRQRLHLRVADSMERAGASSRINGSDVAHHLYSAGRLADPTRTARALAIAGDAAHAVYATEEAAGHYRRALDVLDGAAGHDELRLRIEERLADLLALLGERAGALEHYETAARAHDAAGARVDRARLDRKIGTLHWQAGDRGLAMSCYERARHALDASPAHLEAAHLYQELGLAAFRSGDNQQAIAWAERALESAETALGDGTSIAPEVRRTATAAVAHATNTIGVAMARTGELEAARARIERSVAVARELGLLDVACRAYANLGVLYSTVEPKRAIDVSLTGLELASKIGAASLQSYIYANLAAAYCALTDRCETEGLQAAQAAADLDRQLGQLDHLAVPLIVMAQIRQCRGELEAAQRDYDEALALAEQAGEPQLILPCYDGLATIYLDRGDRVRAEQYMRKARELCERTGVDPDALLLLPFLS